MTEPPQTPQSSDRPVADRAREGDRAALEAMFGQFLPPEEAVVDAEYLGTYGIWWFGTHTFAAVTNRRVAALRVRKLGRITYEDALLEHVSTSAVRQPSRLLFYLLLALVLVPTVGGGIVAAAFVGPSAFVLVLVGLLLLPLAIRLYRAFVKSGLLFWVREGLPVYAYCDRGRLGRANALFRVYGEQRDRFLPGDVRPPPPAVEPASEPTGEGTLVTRARAGDREAIETMFRQFIPPSDAIVASAFLGTQGFGGIGTHSFGCVTQRRVGSLRVSTFGEVIFQESLAANVNGGRIHQPSRIWLYLLVATGCSGRSGSRSAPVRSRSSSFRSRSCRSRSSCVRTTGASRAASSSSCARARRRTSSATGASSRPRALSTGSRPSVGRRTRRVASP